MLTPKKINSRVSIVSHLHFISTLCHCAFSHVKADRLARFRHGNGNTHPDQEAGKWNDTDSWESSGPSKS
jgi:hypothetical protein